MTRIKLPDTPELSKAQELLDIQDPINDPLSKDSYCRKHMNKSFKAKVRANRKYAKAVSYEPIHTFNSFTSK